MAREDSLKEKLTALAGRSGRLGRETPVQATMIFDPAKPVEQQIVRAARAGDREFIASALEDWCEMPAHASRAILAKGGARELIVFFKGMGLTDLGTIQCLLQLDAQIARNIAAYNEAKAMLTGLDIAACRQFVESLGANITKPVSQPIARKPIETQTEIDISALRAIASQRRREILASVGQAPSESPAAAVQHLEECLAANQRRLAASALGTDDPAIGVETRLPVQPLRRPLARNVLQHTLEPPSLRCRFIVAGLRGGRVDGHHAVLMLMHDENGSCFGRSLADDRRIAACRAFGPQECTNPDVALDPQVQLFFKAPISSILIRRSSPGMPSISRP